MTYRRRAWIDRGGSSLFADDHVLCVCDECRRDILVHVRIGETLGDAAMRARQTRSVRCDECRAKDQTEEACG
jgi:hypothetical protein